MRKLLFTIPLLAALASRTLAVNIKVMVDQYGTEEIELTCKNRDFSMILLSPIPTLSEGRNYMSISGESGVIGNMILSHLEKDEEEDYMNGESFSVYEDDEYCPVYGDNEDKKYIDAKKEEEKMKTAVKGAKTDEEVLAAINYYSSYISGQFRDHEGSLGCKKDSVYLSVDVDTVLDKFAKFCGDGEK
ncbi:MAG: hypothetical protein LBI29_00640 [Rickettsiales bacterium]|jgi:hypothetical protein|nr:hypothetical protein [Rickettsiales bacterium]